MPAAHAPPIDALCEGPAALTGAALDASLEALRVLMLLGTC